MVSEPPSRSVVSIYCRDELAYARVFAASFRRHHPETALTMLLLDGQGAADPESQTLTDIAGAQGLTLHDILEDPYRRFLCEIWDRESLRVVSLPFLLDTLLDRFDQVVHLPVRTWFLGPCSDLFDGLDHGSFSLASGVPLRSLLESAADPGQALFRHDYVAVRASPEARRWLRRWKHFIARNQVLNFVHANASALADGFIPLSETPSFASREDETYRQFTLSPSRQLHVDGEPVRSFTFRRSWSPERPATDIGQVPIRVIHQSYASELIENDLHATSHRRYRHDLSAIGTHVSPTLREIMREHADAYRQGDPAKSLIEFVVARRAGGSLLAQSIWKRRPDLHDRFHNIDDPDFGMWLATDGDGELELGGAGLRHEPGDFTLADLMRELVRRDDLRATHPTAFSSRAGARLFATWLVDRGVIEYPGSERAVADLLRRMEDTPIDGADITFAGRADAQAAMPWAMTAAQSDQFMSWIHGQGVENLGIDRFQLDAFAFGVGQLWDSDLQRTWRATRALQRRFPVALTIFDQGQFQAFAVDELSKIDPSKDWNFINGLDLTTGINPLLQLRHLWASEDDLRREFPQPFALGNGGQLDQLVETIEPVLALCGVDDDWRAALVAARQELAERDAPTVRYMGLSRGHTGLGVAARSHADALRTVGIDVFEHPIAIGQKLGGSGVNRTHEPFCNVSILHCNDDLVDEAIAQGAGALFPGGISIGYAVWELDDYEPRLDWSKRVTEIWTPSSFSATAIAPHVNVPVQVMPHPIATPRRASPQRDRFGFTDDDVVFGFCTDAKSRLERKNLVGLVEAFTQAYHLEPKVRLLLKISDPHLAAPAIQDLRARASDVPITFLFDDMTEQELAEVVETMDCYVSLHRSEGFGLTLAEAMARSKPVIATGYSGNTQFMNIANSYPVRYELRPSERLDAFFGAVDWAHADVEHAASLMVHVARNPADAKAVGQRAAAEIAEQFSPERIGNRMRDRLMLLAMKGRG